jgi:hypothetical protein
MSDTAHLVALHLAVSALVETHPNQAALKRALEAAMATFQRASNAGSMNEATKTEVRAIVARWTAWLEDRGGVEPAQ